MTEITASTLLAEMKPAWRAALGDRVSHEYVAGFVRRNRARLEAALAPIAAAMNVVPEVQGEARDKARSTRLRSAATNLAHRRVQVAADSIAKLRHQDVERVLRETPAEERRQVAFILGDLRADLSSEIDEVMREVLGEPESWSEYGRQEIYEPGSRARREATLAEDAAERFQQGDFNALGAVHLPPPSPECSVERALEAATPMIAEAEREIAAAKGEPLPVVMASLEAGGILLLSPLGFLGRDLFQIYRDATSRLQYVSYPKKGQRGIPKVVARAVLALERDGFEVRAETPEVVKSLIVTGGLDHALPVGPPPPRAPQEQPARPPTRTSDPSLIARVNALAADPPTSTLKYLVKTLRERGDLPLQVKDWKEGGWRPVETAIEEAEGKAARRLARKPKAERLRAGGVERPAKDANEEHAAQALIQLANMDPDKAREINDEGFSKSDVATGHALARRWEATGELTGDEWDWAVLVANKYRRQVGPLPEPTGKSKRQRSTAPEGEALSRIELDLLRALVAIRDEADRTDGDDDEAHAWARGAVVPDGKHVTAALIGRSVQVAGLTDGHYRRLSERGLLERRSTDLGGGLIRVRYSITPAGVAAIATAPPVDNRKVAVERQRSTASAKERLFIGIMPTGISYADRSREVDGDYASCAFLPFDTLVLDVSPKCPEELRGPIKADAATIIARRGEQFKISTSGHTVVLGSNLQKADQVSPEGSTKEVGKRERVLSPSDMNYAGNILTTIQDVVSSLKRNLGKIYEGYKLNIGVLRSIGDNSVMLSFYRVPPDASELDASNAKSKVRIVIRGEGRTNGPTWPNDQTPERLTVSTVWEDNAPKLRKRSGPPSAIVAAVVNWFVLNSATLMSGDGPVSFHYVECPKCESSFKVPQNVTAIPAHKCWAKEKEDAARNGRHDERGEEARMGATLRGARDVEEAAWEQAMRDGLAVEMLRHSDPSEARKVVVANLTHNIDYYK